MWILLSHCMGKHKNSKINSAHRKFIASALSEEQATNKILLFLYVNTVLSLHYSNNNWRLSWRTYSWVSDVAEVQGTRESKTAPSSSSSNSNDWSSKGHAFAISSKKHLHICLMKCNRLIAKYTGEWAGTRTWTWTQAITCKQSPCY